MSGRVEAAVAARAASTAISLVIEERYRQREAEGHTHANDDRHVAGELACLAACYAIHAVVATPSRARPDEVTDEGSLLACAEALWPWGEGAPCDVTEGKSPLRLMVIHVALGLAELERRLRAGEQP